MFLVYLEVLARAIGEEGFERLASVINFHVFRGKIRREIFNFCRKGMLCKILLSKRKWFLDEKRDGLVDENRVNNKENKNNRAVFYALSFYL